MQKFQSIKEIILRARVTNETIQIRKWEQEFLLHAEMISWNCKWKEKNATIWLPDEERVISML